MIFTFSLSPLFAQNADLSVISVSSFSAQDYYALKKVKPEDLGFKIVEACIPKGLLAIEFTRSMNENEAVEYVQRMIMDHINKSASPTAYKLEDLRTACQEYRDAINE